jgi:hypothetical protein
MALSATIEQAILDHFLGVAAYTFPANVYVALFTTTPTMPAGTGSYARQLITFSVSGSGPAVGNNTALVQFPTATANWGTIVGAGIYTAATGGVLIDATPLQVSKTIGTGDVFAVPMGNYTVNQT